MNTPFQINDNSPCIDAGTPDTTGLNLPESDLAGEVRIDNERVDMGAYEWNMFVGFEGSEVQPRKLSGKVWSYPNPFTNSTTIKYELQNPSTVQIFIYNHLGERITTLSTWQLSGKQQMIWDATALPCGVYYFSLHAGDVAASGKMVKVE